MLASSLSIFILFFKFSYKIVIRFSHFNINKYQQLKNVEFFRLKHKHVYFSSLHHNAVVIFSSHYSFGFVFRHLANIMYV